MSSDATDRSGTASFPYKTRLARETASSETETDERRAVSKRIRPDYRIAARAVKRHTVRLYSPAWRCVLTHALRHDAPSGRRMEKMPRTSTGAPYDCWLPVGDGLERDIPETQ